jgi:hypothetical protein
MRGNADGRRVRGLKTGYHWEPGQAEQVLPAARRNASLAFIRGFRFASCAVYLCTR